MKKTSNLDSEASIRCQRVWRVSTRGGQCLSYAGAMSPDGTAGRRRAGGPVIAPLSWAGFGARLLPVSLVAVFGLVASACGGASGPAGYGPYPVSLPGAATLCPTLAEVDYYVPVPASAASRIGEQSTTAGVQSTVRCVYGNLGRAPRHSATVTMVLRPSVGETRPRDVPTWRIKHAGVSMIAYRRGHLNSVVIHQGGVDVIVTSAVPFSELEGFAEEELSRIPAADRA